MVIDSGAKGCGRLTRSDRDERANREAGTGRQEGGGRGRRKVFLPEGFSVICPPVPASQRKSASSSVTELAMPTAMAVFLTCFSCLLWLASAAPIGPPDLYRCKPRSPCCLPSPTSPPTPFSRNTSTPVRTRRALQNVLQDTTYLTALRTAYDRLRELSRSSPDDPRGFFQQSNLHCAFCLTSDLSYGNEFNMHGNWYFLPWHRMLLYYHERILGWAAGVPDLALPFWNWDNEAGRGFPAPYDDSGSSLHAEARRAAPERQREIERSVTREMMRTDVVLTDHWHPAMGNEREGGTLETGGHNWIHLAVGRESDRREMGDLQYAANDPIFYTHHANVDRLWEVWLGRDLRPGRGDRRNPSSADFLDSRFTFFDENAMAKVIAVSDVLQLTNLRYSYERVSHDWIQPEDRTPAPQWAPLMGGSGEAPLQQSVKFRAVAHGTGNPNLVIADIKSPYPKSAPASVQSAGVVPMLRFFNIRHHLDKTLELHIFVNEPKANADTPRSGNPKYVQGHAFLPEGTLHKFCLSVSIGPALERLNLTLISNFTVQVVRGMEFEVLPGRLSIEFIDYIISPSGM
ncbi:hypothetical protein CBR_g6605 [Chara braunii]|uniref:Tyrosinase copper-binding domain-containing protein n=1 Tax=Chara braunii TaxID=69332 RepID=A0A388KKC2_CHABU|nr:hypothetical protein CBR_g6605 [Chara braunii]|eukprot:GBG70476.1 hypothetical protein CBR_g6605 [Chara braunii]